VRAFIRDKLVKGKEPSTSGSVMQRQVYVTITGQLFYDDSHVGDLSDIRVSANRAGRRFAQRPFTLAV